MKGDRVCVFGGEFTSPNQEKFKHYSDFWRFDCESTRGNSSSQGRKMVVHRRGPGSGACVTKKDFIVFGGF